MVFIGYGNFEVRYQNIRQSKGWGEYLKSLGWKMYETKRGTKIAVLKTFLGNVTKIQRPEKFDEKELEEMENICRQNKALFVKIEPMHDQDLSILGKYKESSFPLAAPTILVIDLSKSEEELWQDLSKSCKYSVKRAQREGSRVEFFRNPSDEAISDFYKLAKETAKKFKFYIQPISDFLTKRDVFKNECILANLYDSDNELIAGKFLLADNKAAAYIVGGTSEKGRGGKWGYDLQWQVILYFKKHGYNLLDLEGIDDPRFPSFTKSWGGFSYFKEKFGGVKMEFPIPRIKYLNPILKTMAGFVELPL